MNGWKADENFDTGIVKQLVVFKKIWDKWMITKLEEFKVLGDHRTFA